MGRQRAGFTVLLAVVLALALLPACRGVAGAPRTGAPAPSSGASGRPSGARVPPSAAAAHRPNIVFVLTDDLSWNLVRHMPHVVAMRRAGVTFTRFYVTDSLCCPSRASILTGKYPHDTGVFRNSGRHGGFHWFHRHGEGRDTFGVALHRAGYRTGFLGKYLNGYQPARGYDGTHRPYVPPGWDEWDVTGNGYPEYDYLLNQNGHVRYHGFKPDDYLTDVIAGRGLRFARSAIADGKPFLLELATFAPHKPPVPAPRDRHRFAGLTAPRPPSFGRVARRGLLHWQQVPPLTRRDIRHMNTRFLNRVRSVQAVDAMIGRLQRLLRETGADENTYLVFGSDNGYHIGEHRLRPGKNTPYDTDIRVPLVVTGPGVPAGRQVRRIAQTVDLYPTFVDLAGLGRAKRSDGRSLVRLLHGKAVRGWRQGALVEHHEHQPGLYDPDRQPRRGGRPPQYAAVRTKRYLYVEYRTGTREYHDARHDPYQLRNTYRSLPRAQRVRLHRLVSRLTHCHGYAQCRAASRLPS